jgi:hypothetical protein
VTPLNRLTRHQMTMTDVFELGRMRHLDLLALYWRLRGNTEGSAFKNVVQASPGNLVRLILEEARQRAETDQAVKSLRAKLGGRHG